MAIQIINHGPVTDDVSRLGAHVVAIQIRVVAQIQPAADDHRVRPAWTAAGHLDATFDFETVGRTSRQPGLAFRLAEEVQHAVGPAD